MLIPENSLSGWITNWPDSLEYQQLPSVIAMLKINHDLWGGRYSLETSVLVGIQTTRAKNEEAIPKPYTPAIDDIKPRMV